MIDKICKIIERNFLVLAILFSIIALIYPPVFIPIKSYIPIMLGIIMFGMGIMLDFSDFNVIWKRKWMVIAGIIMQYTIMPALAIIISVSLSLSKEVMFGMIIVGSCPSGTASNVMAYLGKADLALSVVLSLATTFLAPILTPFLIYMLVGHSVNVSFWDLVYSVFWIVVFPLIDGLVIRHFLYKKIKNFIKIFPTLSVLAIVLTIACVVSLNKLLLMTFPILIFIAVILHNCLGLSLGYFIGKLFRASETEARTLAFEIGMQNSGLGVTLSTQFFTATAALPSTIFSLWHNISGILLAKWWSRKNS